MADADWPGRDRGSLPLGERPVELSQPAEQRVGPRLSRAQDVVGYVAVPGCSPPDSRPGCIFMHRRLRRELTILPLVVRFLLS
jgi:hypothetical protein